MKIHTLVIGPIQTNCCIIFDENTKEGIVIDPGDQAEKILTFIMDNSLKVNSVIATHGHWDHVTAAAEVKNRLQVPFMVHEKDAYLFSGAIAPFAALMGFRAEHVDIDRLLKENDKITAGDISLSVIHTPGHTPGSCGFFDERNKVLFSGDTLFRGGIGRTDFPGGSSGQIIDSIKNKLLVLPDDTKVIPGHGQSTTIGREKNDPYIKGLAGNT